jgi:predicted O-linked N-acetylglucosamine transferase (SPINDLY family)
MALLAQDRIREAEAALCRAVALAPQNPDAWNALGSIWHRLGRLPDAAAAFLRALDLRPGFSLAEQNRKHARASMRERPFLFGEVSGESENNQGVALLQQHRHADAEKLFRSALQLDPNLPPEAWYNLARALDCQGQSAAAEALYRSVLKERPAMQACHRFLADLLFAQKRLQEAEAAFQKLARAEAAEPIPERPLRQAEILSNLASDVLSIQGRPEEARGAYQEALALEPGYAVIHSNALLNEHYAPDVTLAGLARLHSEFERRHTASLRSTWLPFANSRNRDRPLRLGFVSGDLFLHPVGMFLAPLLERLDRAQWPTVCYSTHRKTDFLTARLVQAAGQWRQVSERSDEALADLIRGDGIDLLFDLAGHTGRNRLLTFARRPAPVQLSWMGYVGTTGVSAIDYLIADRFHIPPGWEHHYRETVLRLPDDYICYEAPAYAPAVGPLPALTTGHVTFGCFNNSTKITPPVVAVWAEILRRVPDSRLVLKCQWYDDAAVRGRQLERFAAAGIGAERLDLQGKTAHMEQLEQYNRIDLALDTFPYSGGLTTCEACWMGVPVVTCPGETFASRHSLSHLSNMGLTQAIARDHADYVAKAIQLAADVPRLVKLRANLRERMARSPLCDFDRFVENFGAAMRRTWHTWCSSS